MVAEGSRLFQSMDSHWEFDGSISNEFSVKCTTLAAEHNVAVEHTPLELPPWLPHHLFQFSLVSSDERQQAPRRHAKIRVGRAAARREASGLDDGGEGA